MGRFTPENMDTGSVVPHPILGYTWASKVVHRRESPSTEKSKKIKKQCLCEMREKRFSSENAL
jgi:hypothetical protein